jgi:hypothetical protein
MFGRGAHPVVMAAATVRRLQTIVSRELAASAAAVVTVGSLQAGEKENVTIIVVWTLVALVLHGLLEAAEWLWR